MTFEHKAQSASEPAIEPAENLIGEAALPPAPQPQSDEDARLWAAYRLQQRRRACPGCGDDGEVF